MAIGLGNASLISMREIAELAGVQRPVVTMWRHRHPDFPGLSGGDDLGPLFDPGQVADWLVRTGRITQERADMDLSLFTLTGQGAGLPASEFIGATTALICLRYLDGGEPLAGGTDDIAADLVSRAERLDPKDELVQTEVRCLGADSCRLALAIDALIEAAWGEREAFEQIMAARRRLKAADLYADSVVPELTRLIAGICGAKERARRPGPYTVTDLDAGAGDLLASVAHTVGQDQLPIFTGAESDFRLARLVRRRLIVHGVPQEDMDIRIADELPDEAGDPDIIITQVPYAAGKDRPAHRVLDMVGDVSVRLGLGCSAVVLGPADVLAGGLRPYSPAERTRSKFLTSGMVEAVIRLPGGLAPFRPGYEMALWVLTADQDARWPGRILLADMSRRELTAEAVEALTEDVITWRRSGYHPSAHTPVFAVQHRISDLTDPPRPLIADRRPSAREFAVESPARVARVTQLEAELDRAAAHATAERRPVWTGVAAGPRTPPRSAAIGTLSRAGRLVIKQGARLRDIDVITNGHHLVLGSREVLAQTRRGDRTIDRAVLARYPRAQLTHPGDVVVTMAPDFGAVVDHQGLAVVEYPARILRIPEAEQAQFTPRVLAALLTAGGGGSRPPRAVRPAQRLEDHRVALLSPAEVRMLDALLKELGERERLARLELGQLSELRDITTAGLIDGTLVLTGDAA